MIMQQKRAQKICRVSVLVDETGFSYDSFPTAKGALVTSDCLMCLLGLHLTIACRSFLENKKTLINIRVPNTDERCKDGV